MALPNPSMSFSPFAILTAEEMNDLVENIEALADGSGLNDGAIGPAKTTLFRTQTDNSDVIANAFTAGIRVQAGWIQAIGNNTATFNQAVTFPEAFTTVLGVIASPLGGKATTAATSITDITTAIAVAKDATPNSITNTGFTLSLTRASGTYANTTYYGASWLAWGI